MSSGVYKIYHEYNPNKLYIGSTYVGFDKRFKQHLSKLRHNKHNNSHLQNVANKHGIDGFTYDIVEKVEKNKCLEREQYWIDTLNVFKEGYNQSKTAKNCVLDTEKKIELSKKVWKPVYQLDENNNIIKKFKSIKQAERALNLEFSSISRCCNTNKGSSGGYFWSFVDTYDPLLNRGKIIRRNGCGEILFNINLKDIL